MEGHPAAPPPSGQPRNVNPAFFRVHSSLFTCIFVPIFCNWATQRNDAAGPLGYGAFIGRVAFVSGCFFDAERAERGAEHAGKRIATFSFLLNKTSLRALRPALRALRHQRRASGHRRCRSPRSPPAATRIITPTTAPGSTAVSNADATPGNVRLSSPTRRPNRHRPERLFCPIAIVLDAGRRGVLKPRGRWRIAGAGKKPPSLTRQRTDFVEL